jgi:hypothetical protein
VSGRLNKKLAIAVMNLKKSADHESIGFIPLLARNGMRHPELLK